MDSRFVPFAVVQSGNSWCVLSSTYSTLPRFAQELIESFWIRLLIRFSAGSDGMSLLALKGRLRGWPYTSLLVH